MDERHPRSTGHPLITFFVEVEDFILFWNKRLGTSICLIRSIAAEVVASKTSSSADQGKTRSTLAELPHQQETQQYY